MLNRSKNTAEESTRPLLDSDVFAIHDDDEDDIEVIGRLTENRDYDDPLIEPAPIDDRSIPPPLRSMVQSRETGGRCWSK